MDAAALKKPLSDVVEAVDGKNLFTGCGLGLEYCSVSNPCPLHHEFKAIRNKIQQMLKNTSIADFNEDLNLEITKVKK